MNIFQIKTILGDFASTGFAVGNTRLQMSLTAVSTFPRPYTTLQNSQSVEEVLTAIRFIQHLNRGGIDLAR